MMSRVRTTTVAGLALAALALFSQPAAAQQASITLTNCGAEDCLVHNNNWEVKKEVKTNTISNGAGTVTWTVTATKSDGGTTYAVHGGLTVTNTGSAPATIGNIVVNLQRPNSPKQGSNASHVSIAADVADATNGDAATSANIVAAGSQENAATNTAWGTANYTLLGTQGTFTETSCSGALEFKDASNNTVFSLVPQPVIPVGGSVTLLYDAGFDTSCLPAAGTQLRVEAMVTFGNAGARGGGGSVGSNIDVNGSGSVDADEAKVRTVPCRVSLGGVAATATEANDSVTVTDTGATTTGTVTATNPVGFDAFPAVVSDTTSWDVSVDVDAGAEGGQVCNAADLAGTAVGGTLNVIVEYTPYIYDEFNNIIGGHVPIYATYTCVEGAEGTASTCVDVNPPEGLQDGDFCTYGQGAYAGTGAPGLFFNANFATTFASGLTIGINDALGPRHHALWTALAPGPANLKTTLAGGGPSGALTADTTNATSISGGALAKQVATLSLNVGFSGVLPIPAGFGALVYSNLGDSLDGQTISQILGAANGALGGTGLPALYTFGTLNTLITNLNASFDNCILSAWAAIHLSKP